MAYEVCWISVVDGTVLILLSDKLRENEKVNIYVLGLRDSGV